MQEVDRDDKPEIILKKVFESDVQWLYDSLKVIDAGAVERVAHMLLEYDKVVAWAVGMSTPFVYYLQQRLLRLGRMCALLTDPYEMEVQSGMVDADTRERGGRAACLTPAAKRKPTELKYVF